MTVAFERRGHVALITIDRPDALNALNADAYAGLSDAWLEVRDDSEIWAAVVTGAGEKAFCVGADLKEPVPDPDAADLWQTQQLPLLNRGMEVWKPVVAAVNGYCLGGGLTLLLATDLRVAGSEAVFGFGEVAVGLVPGNGGSQRILDQVPYAVGMEMLLLGRRLNADEALAHGLVNGVVAPADVVEEALRFAQRLTDLPPLALRAAKELAVRSRTLPLGDGLRLEEMALRHLRTTADAAEGRTAFAEHRRPRFSGR